MYKRFDCSLNYELENERVMLRPLQYSDLNHLLQFSMQEPYLWEYALQCAAGEGNLKSYINEAIDNRNKNKEYAFIVFDKIQGEYAGCTRFYDIQVDNETVQLGYTWYGKKFQGTGINKNCKYLLLEFAFEKWGVKRVEFRADNNNVKSIAAMKSIGCQIDGILRSNVTKPNNKRIDSIVLSILENEWFDYVKQMLQTKL